MDYGGNSFRWFDTDEMLKVHGSSRLPGFLAQNIQEHFKVPVQFQVLCDLQGPLSSQDFQRVLSGDESPRLWLFDARYMGDDLRKQFERRQKADAAARAAASPTEPVALPWTSAMDERSVDSEVLALGVAKLSETLERREQQVAQMLHHHAEEIQELQRELTASRPARDARGALFAEKVNLLSQSHGDAEDAVSFSMEQHDKLRDMDSEDAEVSIQLLEAEEAMLLQSVQEALAKITSDTPSTTWATWRSQPTPDETQAPQLDLTRTERSESQAPLESPALNKPCRGVVFEPRGSGPLPPLLSLDQYNGQSSREDGTTEKLRLQQDLEEALATARKAQELELQSQQLLQHWQARASAAEEATKAQEAAETAQLRLQCQLEVEVALRNKDLEHAQEIQQLKDEMHQSELEHQADVLALRHRNGLLTEQEEWQQMEILLLRSQQMQSEKAQEQQVQDLQSSIEWERLSAQLRSKEMDAQLSETRSEKEKNQELGARLAGRDLELLALEQVASSARTQEEQRAEALRRAMEEGQKLAAELAEKSEKLQKEEAGNRMHLAEIAQQGEEISASRGREEQLRQRVACLERDLEEALRAAPAPAPEPVVVEPAPVRPVSDYISTADDDLDKCLEQEILQLGPGVLKGNQLERTGPKRYKIGDQKIFMQLSEGRVTVRVGGAYIPLQQWTKELTVAGEQGNDDPFSALDAQSPFAAVR